MPGRKIAVDIGPIRFLISMPIKQGSAKANFEVLPYSATPYLPSPNFAIELSTFYAKTISIP